MKILFDGRILMHKEITGVERYSKSILECLRKSRGTIDVLVPSYTSRLFQHFWEHSVLPLKSQKYDILFCPANIAPLWKPKKTKLVVTIHSLSYKYFPDSYSMFFEFYYKMVTPRIIKLADKIIAVSDTEKKRIIENYPLAMSKITTIYNGINTECFQNKTEKSQQKEKYILYIGSFNPLKNLLGVVKAFSKIYGKINSKLVIIGVKTSIFCENKEFVKALKSIPKGLIEFKGQINDPKLIARYYANASALVFPSFYEACSFPPLEAMACGCPVIASNIPSLVEICGDAAYYVNPFDIDNIARGIVTVLGNKSMTKGLIIKGVENAKCFSWDEAGKKTLKVFSDVLH